MPRRKEREGFRTILVPLDGSELAERVLPYAQRLATPASGAIVLLQVTASAATLIARSGTMTPGVGGVDLVATAEALRGEAGKYLRRVVERLGEGDVRAVVAEGDAGEQIIGQAQQLGADLVAMTTHGRGGLERVVFGSVADAVLRAAPCPIFLLPHHATSAAGAQGSVG